MKYIELKQKHQKEFSEFPIRFAFSDKQFKEILNYFNITKENANKELCRTNFDGFYRKSDSQALKNLMNRHDSELETAMKNDEFLIDAIEYELANHEYCITYDETDTIYALNLNFNDPRVYECFKKARKNYLETADI